MSKRTATPKAKKASRARKVAPVAPVASPVRCEVQNGVRKPQKGVCADVWSWMGDHRDAAVADVRAWAEKKGLNVGNALQERSAFRRFHGIKSQGVQQAA